MERKLQNESPSIVENQSANIIIDEADRLQLKTLEQVREIYDEKEDMGIILYDTPKAIFVPGPKKKTRTSEPD